MSAKSSNAALVISRPGGNQDIKLDYSSLRRAAIILRAVSHPLRKQMIALMEEKKKMTVTEIYTKMKLEQSVASQHLAILRKAKITTTSRDGKFIYYSIDRKRVAEINGLAEDLAKPI
jgi:DNA-binding transcriptional ArsR family regulator